MSYLRCARSEPYNALSVENARRQLLNCSAMINRRRHIESAPEREAETISRASDREVRDYVRRGIMERWLSRVVHSLSSGSRASRRRVILPVRHCGGSASLRPTDLSRTCHGRGSIFSERSFFAEGGRVAVSISRLCVPASRVSPEYKGQPNWLRPASI